MGAILGLLASFLVSSDTVPQSYWHECRIFYFYGSFYSNMTVYMRVLMIFITHQLMVNLC